ncbi:MAG TPA: dienelactone hydrolase family protein [Rudaea sp.]|nr:dienelactone hydrolase family protein [Rudaea sp.]
MGRQINLNTSGMQCIGAYLAKPEGTPKGGIVVVQEIFGVNAHVRDVADGFAAHGYTAIAPAFFDHVETGVELGYDEEGFRRGRALVSEIGLERALEDVASAAQSIDSAGRIGVVGYCWGGTVALLSATRLGLPSVSYYGARNVAFLDEKPRAPVQFHFGERDNSIPPEAVQKHRDAYPDMQIFTYPAGHAFNRAVDPTHYDAPSARLALDRTLAFFERHLRGA